MNIKVERIDKMVHRVQVFLDNQPRNHTLKLFFPGDIHHDNPKCVRPKLHEHLQRAVDEDALIISIGDQFCLMEGKYDPRRSKEGIRPENNYENYIDRVIKNFDEDLGKYAKNWAFMGYGNHETNIVSRLHTDPIERLCERWRLKHNSPVVPGNYQGYILFDIMFPKDTPSKYGTRFRYVVWYHHGGGSSAPVTDGIINMKRQKVWVEGADLLINGHKHTAIYKPERIITINSRGTIQNKKVDLVRIASYKDEFQPFGWAVEKQFKPSSIDSAFIEVDFHRAQKGGIEMNRRVSYWD
ncbi:MAG: hypothetical protein GWN62_16805 [Aliifodinibius sp.]|nr:hypothetical protein [Fodinibius sp.]